MLKSHSCLEEPISTTQLCALENSGKDINRKIYNWFNVPDKQISNSGQRSSEIVTKRCDNVKVVSH